MESAKVSANGRIIVPVEIRRRLGLHSGDEILFFENKDGDIVLKNAAAFAIHEAQAAFAGVAEEINVKDEEDVQKLVDEVRHGKK